MGKITERKARTAIKQKRLAALLQLDVYQKQIEQETEGTKAYVDLQKKIYVIGQQLQQLVHYPGKYPEEINVPVFKEVQIDIPKEKIELTLDLYVMYKQKGFNDDQVALACGQTKYYVDHWKKENGITAKKAKT